MEEIIPLTNIKAQLSASDWQDAIRHAGEILLTAGSIQEKYIDSMISAVYEYGPYMVIMPGLAIAHAAPGPDNGVIQNDVSLINLTSPVSFISEEKIVSVVLCISCTDHDSHLKTMRRVAKALMKEGSVDLLTTAKTDQEMYDIINS